MLDVVTQRRQHEPMLQHYAQLGSEQIIVLFDETDRTYAELTATSLTEALAWLIQYFVIAECLPPVRAILAPNRAAFDALVADVLHVKIGRPSDPRRIAQPQRSDIVFLSPSAYSTESRYDYLPADYTRMVWHELVHVIQEYLTPDIESSPLWWDEGLAVYLSGQWRSPSQFRFREPVLDRLSAGQLPTLSDIEADGTLAYSFGWTLVRFIELLYGCERIRLTVRVVSNGDIFGCLRTTAEAFERRWLTWLRSSPVELSDDIPDNSKPYSRLPQD